MCDKRLVDTLHITHAYQPLNIIPLIHPMQDSTDLTKRVVIPFRNIVNEGKNTCKVLIIPFAAFEKCFIPF